MATVSKFKKAEKIHCARLIGPEGNNQQIMSNCKHFRIATSQTPMGPQEDIQCHHPNNMGNPIAAELPNKSPFEKNKHMNCIDWEEFVIEETQLGSIEDGVIKPPSLQ